MTSQDAVLSFNSPWECRIGLTNGLPFVRFTDPHTFQFPVGMSNRSYFAAGIIEPGRIPPAPFNSPWECRIGLTKDLRSFVTKSSVKKPFNSPWECRIGLT